MPDPDVQTIRQLLGNAGLREAQRFALDYAVPASDAYRLFAALAVAANSAGLRYDLTAPVLATIRRQAAEMIALGQPVDCGQIKLEP